MKKEFIDRLGKELLFLDGAIGTVLQERGLGAGELPELWNFKKEDEILNLLSCLWQRYYLCEHFWRKRL